MRSQIASLSHRELRGGGGIMFLSNFLYIHCDGRAKRHLFSNIVVRYSANRAVMSDALSEHSKNFNFIRFL